MNPRTLKIQCSCKVLQISYTKCSIEHIVHSCAHLSYIFYSFKLKNMPEMQHVYSAICLIQQQKPKPLFWWVCASLWVVASVYLLITMSLHTNSESIFFPCLLYDVFACLERFYILSFTPSDEHWESDRPVASIIIWNIVVFYMC